MIKTLVLTQKLYVFILRVYCLSTDIGKYIIDDYSRMYIF